MMKKVMSLFLVLALTVTIFAGCGNKANEEPTVEETEEVVETQEETSEDTEEAEADSDVLSDTTTDVLVVGGGGSGVAAAVKAAEAGKEVVLIEKMPMLGGVTILNAGTLVATGSRFQVDELGEENDSPELLYEDIMKAGSEKNDPVLAKMISERAGEIVDWLVDDLGVEYDVAATQYPDHSAHRQIGVVGRSPAFIEQMSAKIVDMGGKIATETKAEELIVEDGAVTGVKATNAAGEEIEILADSVILASGGYGANPDLLPETLDGIMFYGLDSETGDGLMMAEKAGADTINLDLVKVYPQGVETRPGRALAATASSTAATNGHGSIYVNKEGNRFISEVDTLGALTLATIDQTDKMMYIVMDQEAWDTYVEKSLEDKLVSSEEDLFAWGEIENNGFPIMVHGDNLEELATTMGIDPAGLIATIDSYNAMVEAGADSDFAKEDPVAIGEGPYYIVEQKARFQTTLGGVKANESLEVLDTEGQPIPNLYGAGCFVGGANGADSMTAMMNSWAVMSGYVAGEAAAANVK